MDKKISPFKKIVASHLAEDKGSLFLAGLCLLGYTVAELLAPWPLKFIFDYVLLEKVTAINLPLMVQEVIEGNKTLAVILLCVFMLLIALSRGMFSYFQIFLTSRVGFRLVYKLRRELFSHLQLLSLSFHARTKSGELLTKLTSDTKIIRGVFSDTFLEFIAQVMVLIGMLIVMALLSWKLTLIAIATFPVLIYALSSLYNELKKSQKKQRKREGIVASKINELLPAISLVQSFAREQYEADLFDVDSTRTLKQSIKVARMVASTARTVQIIKAFGVSSTVLFGALQAVEGTMTPGDVLIFVTYINGMYGPIQKLAKLAVRISKAMTSAERISKLLEIEPAIRDRDDAIQAKNIKGDIVFREVSFAYEGEEALFQKLSFSIASGQRVALVGASGAGKSTIAKLLLRLYDIQSGGILVDGVDIRDYQRESLRQEIGIVAQDPTLFGTSIKENILYGKPDATDDAVLEAAKLAHAHEFIAALPDGYETVLGERGSTLSGGQRQRIGLARAIIKQPPV
ncbi:MAG: ABC transporter ATP-binding protein, partial [Nitrospiria bacterium]